MPEKLMLARADQVTFAAPLREVWSQLWFQDKPTSPLEITRMGIGAALLLHYGLATPYLLKFWGDDGWMPRSLLAHEINSPWAQSVFSILRLLGSGTPSTRFSCSAAPPL